VDGQAIIEAARAHLRARASEGLAFVEVAQWIVDGAPARIYYRPFVTMAERHRIDKATENGRIYTILEALITRARDAEGKALWKAGDRETLMNHTDSDIIMEIAERMARGTEVPDTPEDVAGKSEATPS
jgi:hypothetical protein